MLHRQLVIRADNHGQEGFPQLHSLLIRDIRHIRWSLLPVACVKLGDDVSNQAGSLSSDVPLLVHEKLI